MTKVAVPHIPLSLSYKCCVNLRFFILVIVKQCNSFNNSQHFRVSLSLSKALPSYLLILVLNYNYFLNIKMVGMLKDMKCVVYTQAINERLIT